MKRLSKPFIFCFIVILSGYGFISVNGETVYPELVNQSSVFPQEFAVLDTNEQIAFSDHWKQQTVREIPIGGHAMVIVGMGNNQACEPIEASINDINIYAVLPTKITSPSSEQTPQGNYYDILVPLNSTTCQLSPFRLIEWKPMHEGMHSIRAGDYTVNINVTFNGRFIKPKRPFFVGLSNSFLIKGHCQSYCPREAELAKKYKSLLQDHHITPIQSWVIAPPIKNGTLNLNAGDMKGISFWQTGSGKDQHFINFPNKSLYPNPQVYLQALEKTIQKQYLQGRAWVYVKDEPQDFNALVQDLKQYRTFAPSVLTMVTTPYRKELEKLVDIFAPNIAQWDTEDVSYTGKLVWPYASCMGSCGPNRAYKVDVNRVAGPEVGRPDFLIDRSARFILDYFKTLSVSNTQGGLYYHATEGHVLYRKGIDILTDPWNFGGNGDGVLVYPGRPGELGLEVHTPLPSFRLKLIRHAQEYYN